METSELGSAPASEEDAQPGELGEKQTMHGHEGGNMEVVWNPSDQLAEASQMASEITRKGLLRRCKRCKHLMHLGVWGPLHPTGGSCQVVDADPQTGDGATSHGDTGFCRCPVCLPYVKLLWQHAVGEMKGPDAADDDESRRAPKRCRTCGATIFTGEVG